MCNYLIEFILEIGKPCLRNSEIKQVIAKVKLVSSSRMKRNSTKYVKAPRDKAIELWTESQFMRNSQSSPIRYAKQKNPHFKK